MSRRHVIALLTVGALALPAVAAAQQLVYVVRHAERADGGAAGAQMGAAAPDPPLSDAGRVRAAKLASMLSVSGINAIYTTQFLRTQETASPLAAAFRLKSNVVLSGDTATLVARMKADHPKDIVLVVGHSNTIPAIIKALGGPTVKIADDEYDKLFIVVPGTGTMTVIRY